MGSQIERGKLQVVSKQAITAVKFNSNYVTEIQIDIDGKSIEFWISNRWDEFDNNLTLKEFFLLVDVLNEVASGLSFPKASDE